MIPSATVVRMAIGLARVLPATLLRALAWGAGSAAYAGQPDRRRVLLENLRRTAPNASERERRRLARRTLRNMAATAVDLYRLPSMRRQDWESLVVARGREHVDAAFAMGKGVIGVTAHLGPYELGGAWLASVGYPVHAMVEDLAPDVSAALAAYRRASGMELVSMKEGFRGVYRLLEQGRMVLLVADRAVGDTRGVVELPFGRGVRPVPTGPATFAMSTGAPIIVGHITLSHDGPARYVVEFEAPIVPSGRGEAERLRLTRLITERLAAAVQKHPDEWYVFQPQWVAGDRD